MEAFFTALSYVFIAEIGDKTQLMTLAFSARFKARIVLLGVTIASGLINLISVGLGVGVGKLLPVFWIGIIAGLAFIAFGIWELRPEDEEEAEEETKGHKHGPLMTVIIAFFLAELGDKTMLAAVAVASKQPQFIPVWLGSTLGLVASNAIAIVAGKLVKEKMSAKSLKIAIAVVYIISGIASIAEAFMHRGA